MDDEEFDELSMDRSTMSMGSRNSRTSTSSRNNERANPYSESTSTSNPNPQLFRSQSSGRPSGSAPPSFAFNSGNSSSRATSPPPESPNGAFGNDAEIARTLSQSPESRRIRQEALRMLEVADDQLHDGAYSVYRTSTGGFAAEPRKANEEKRVPSALSGLSFASSRKNVARPFRDDPYADTEAPAPTSQESYEYGDENAVVDVAHIESRSAAARAASPSNNWSSRYSLDNTLMALSGGSVTSSKFLDKMDEDNRKTARSNIFNSGPSATKSPKVFGSGFSFRSSNVFGQQSASKQETNLKSSWMESAVETPASPARSWQEQFIKKRRQRRRAIIIAVAVIVALVFLIIEFQPHKQWNMTSNSSNSSSSPGSKGGSTKIDVDEDPPVDGVSFYVTSDVPIHSVRDDSFMNDLKGMNLKATFLAHLGDVQLATNTLCKPDRYLEVAQILRQSPLPVFVLPGEEDWANCLDQSDGWANWVDAFWKFENGFESDIKVYRMEGQEENYAFVEDGVLFVGVHEHNGRIVNEVEHNKRNHRNVEWVKASYELFEDDVRAFVILANGRPGLRANDPFYLGMGEFLFENKIPTAYVHANDNNGKEVVYSPYEIDGMEHVIAIQTNAGEDYPPLRITVADDYDESPFVVDMN